MSKNFLMAIPFLGLGSVGVFAGYKTYRLVWPQKWFEPQLVWGDKLTFSQYQEKMEGFRKEISTEQREKTVYLWDIPMPGKHMLWAHQDDSDFWKQRSKELAEVKKSGNYQHIPHEVNKLKKWCSLHLNTRVHVKVNDKDELQFRLSKDDHVSVGSVASVSDLSDIRNNCARIVTNKEFYSSQLLNESDAKWSANNCSSLVDKHYSESDKRAFQNCLKTKKEESFTSAFSSFISFLGGLIF